ncbi:hypothetical protein SUNI508_02941 [Seiridium unicorne]|uniref:Reverse transcriptase domain-containing protein n=1 Tax=Seiridium unicorne TaxID=138068 RepID=A0ABR2VGL8_9PEZI
MTSTSGNIFSETLQEITNTKLEELSKSRADFERKKASVLSQLEGETGDPIKRLTILSGGVKHCLGVKTDKTSGKVLRGQTKSPALEIELKNLDLLLSQARYDPSVSTKSFKAWESSLLCHLDTESLKYQYASLYAELVTEWLSSGKVKPTTETAEPIEGPAADHERVAEEKRAAARLEWERTVFEPADVNEKELRSFLAELFQDDDHTKTKRNALNTLKESIAGFETHLLSPSQFNEGTLGWAIGGLLTSDLLPDEKREVLKSFQDSPVILSEIADVLNMRIAAFDNWSWGRGVAVEQQRKISGTYNIHMHEDLLQAIFLQYIGVKWSVFFKDALKRFRKFGGPWKSIRADVPKIDKKRLGYYLGSCPTDPSVQHIRRSLHRKDYFLSHLLDAHFQHIEVVDGEEEAERAEEDSDDGGPAMRFSGTSPSPSVPSGGRGKGLGKGGAMRHRRILVERDPEDTETDDESDARATSKKPMEAKQKLLHILATEIAVNTRIHGEFTALRTTFDSWNSLLPHATVRTVLDFFGVSHQWLEFFDKFLEAPLKFIDEDNAASPRIRRRGTPASHVLSNVFGEVILFCLDFSINQRTDGALLYRLYDDLWFWGPEHQVSVNTWKTIERFASVTGTKLNQSKTGTVRISGNPDVTLSVDQSLPKGQISWGFLRLSSETGRFEINQPMVDKHVEELKRQLEGKKSSMFAFIQTWNTYAATFFTSNFGQPANCFGRNHVDLMLSTHSCIQREIFKSGSSLSGEGIDTVSVVDYLKGLLSQRFGVNNIPDAYLFFPVELGGLDLQSPFIPALQIRDLILKDPSTLLDTFEENERDEYSRAKRAFEKGEITPSERSDLEDPDWVPIEKHDRETFMSFEEFTRWREEFSLGFAYELSEVYEKLLEKPGQETLELDNERVASGIKALGRQKNLRGILADWPTMEPYWKWVVMQYGPEVMERFGGLSIVDAGLLPMGMVSLFRDKRVKWQG